MSPSFVVDPPLSSSSPSRRRRVGKRWGRVVVVATFALYFVLYGTLFSYNILFVAFQEEFGSSATLTGWVGSIPLSISLMLAPFIKLASERFSYRLVSVLGIVLVSAGVFVTSFLSSLPPMFGTYGLMAGVGAGIVTVCAFDLIVLYFPEKNTMRAVAFSVTGSTAGMLSLTQIMAVIIAKYEWRITLRIMGALLFIVGLPCVLTYIPPSGHHSNNTKKKRNYRVISKQDIYIIDRVVETFPEDSAEKYPLNGLQHSPPKLDAISSGELLPDSVPAYRVVDGLGDDRESLILDEERRANDTTTKVKTEDNRSLISDEGSEGELVAEDTKRVLFDDEKHYRPLTMNFDVSSQTTWDESRDDAKASGITMAQSKSCSGDVPQIIVDQSEDCSGGVVMSLVHDSKDSNIAMDQSKNFQQEWQSDDDSPATTARRHPRNNNKEVSILGEVDTLVMNSEKPLNHPQDAGMLRKIGRALTFPELWLISIATIINGIGECFYYVNAISYLMSVGFMEHTGVHFVSFTALANLVGKVSLVFIGEYLPFPRIFLQVISNVISIIVWILFMIVRSVIPVYCIAAAAGITMAITNVVVFSLAPDFFGEERAMETSSVVYFCYGSGYLLGSLVGQSIDNTGSYTSALWSFIGMYVTSGTMLLAAPLYQRIFAPERFVTFDIHRKKREARRERSLRGRKERHRCRVSMGQLFVCEKVSSV